MDVAAETVQLMGPHLVIHGLTTIDTLNESAGTWIPANSVIRRTPYNTHGIACGNFVGQGTVVVEAVRNYIEENYKTDFEIARKNSKLQSKRKNIEMF